jgi:hypothetical protein
VGEGAGRIMTATYKACPIKRDRRTRAEIAAIKSALYDVLKSDHPMTVRQVFYQLVVRSVIEKTEEQYQGTVIRLLTEMRMADEIPFSWIVDESRRRLSLRSFNSVADAVEDCAKYYRRNAMRESSVYIELWTKKEALSGIIWDEAGDYGVPVLVSKGMPSITQLYQTALQVRAADRAGKGAFIYQFGDHDPSGVLIPKTIEDRLEELCGKLRCNPPTVERIALTLEHIAEFNLPTRPTKRDGNSHAHKFEGDSVELDALPADELRRLVRECIEWHISDEELEVLNATEKSEREFLKSWARDICTKGGGDE